METSERVAGIIAALKQEYPDALCALHYGKDYAVSYTHLTLPTN